MPRLEKLFLYVAENFGKEVALLKLAELEEKLLELGVYPNKGVKPHYLVLRRQGYRVLVLEKNLVFYKVNDVKKEVTIYAVVDQR